MPLLVAGFAFVAGNSLASEGESGWLDILPWVGVAIVPTALAAMFSLLNNFPAEAMDPTLLTGDTLVLRRCAAETCNAEIWWHTAIPSMAFSSSGW